MLFSLYLYDDIIRLWKIQFDVLYINEDWINENFIISLLHTEDQVIISDNENTLQLALHKLKSVAGSYNLYISSTKMKPIAFICN